MSKQFHKNFTDAQVNHLLKSYLNKKNKISCILQMVRIESAWCTTAREYTTSE